MHEGQAIQDATELEFRGTRRFQLLRRLGAGGMGVVYEALDKDRDTHVALKTLRHLNAEGVFRFKNEFRALQDVQHPNLVSLDELIEEEGQWFLTMELVDGCDFLAYVRPTPGMEPAQAFDPTDRVPTGYQPPRTSSGPLARVTEPQITTRGASEMVWQAHANAEPGYDEGKLRFALGQLARGLAALHAAAKVHRDIKPSNMLVTRAGRVVLLDFGLVANLEEWATSRSDENQVVGTTAYMAPEQAASKPIGPPADWYAVGVVLYEALTGRLPFSGGPMEVLMNKQRFEPAPPRALVPAVPRDLDALCVELLRFEPSARPTARDVLKRLNVEEAFDTRGAPSVSSSAVHTPPFVGRVHETDALRDAFGSMRAGRAVTLFVEGQSGVGKSVLVKQFTRNLVLADPDVLVLAGRCYERESVPYKAFDGVVDALSRYMLELGTLGSLALLPQKAALLAQVFPVLRRVESIAQAPLLKTDVLDPQELRTRVFAALRELLMRLADKRPVVIVIDDLQWADADSLALLREVTRPPDPPPLLLIGTMRDVTDAAAVGTLNVPAAMLGDVRRLHLEMLPAAQARELAAALIGRLSPQRTGDEVLDMRRAQLSAETIAAESGGHPLFIDELVRHALVANDSAPGPLRLDEALWARICRLETPVRRLLNLIAVASAPIDQASLARAEGADFAELTKRISILRVANLVRSSGARGLDRVEPYHDWVRAAMLAHLDVEARRVSHERLAVALEAGGPRYEAVDAEALMVHWRGAGAPHKAAKYAARAADQASTALAFDRAARLYRLALELLPPQASSRRALEEKLGDAQANAGRGAEAAGAYLRAMVGASAAEQLDLQRRAADQLLRSGHIDEGLETLRKVLADVGMTLPATPQRALTTLLWRRARIWMRGLGFRERDSSQIAQEALTRIDICWSAAGGLAMVDTIRGAGFQAQNLLLALDAGEPYRVARALAMEAAFISTEGGPARSRYSELFIVAEQMSRRVNHPHTLGLTAMVGGNADYFNGMWKRAREQCDRAEEIFRDHCTGVAWEMSTAQTFSLWSLLWLGELREFSRRVAALVSEAQERGDLFATTAFRTARAQYGYPAADDPAGGRREVDEVMRSWSHQGFQLPHWWEMFAIGNLALYEGGDRCHRMLASRWPELAGSMLLRIQLLRLESFHLRARGALAAAASGGGGGTSEKNALLREARKHAAQMKNERMPWSDPLASLVLAGCANTEGNTAAALDLIDEAAARFQAADMRLFFAIARRARGQIIGGDEGRSLVIAADQFMIAERIVRPSRFAAMLAPGFPE